MSNILENLKKRLQVWHEERAARLEAARQAELDEAARREVKTAVQAARENYKDWKEEKLWERRGTTHAFTLF